MLRIPVAVAVTVDVVDACPVALVLKALELRDVGIRAINDPWAVVFASALASSTSAR